MLVQKHVFLRPLRGFLKFVERREGLRIPNKANRHKFCSGASEECNDAFSQVPNKANRHAFCSGASEECNDAFSQVLN